VLCEGFHSVVPEVPDAKAEEMVQAHLHGECAISTSFADDDNMVTCMAIDIDILNKWLSDPTVELSFKKREALNVANVIVKQAKQLGLDVLLEDSGSRGYHIWFPIEGAINVAEAAEMTRLLLTNLPDFIARGIGIERFPSAKRIRNDQKVKLLRLPCGRHPTTGVWCPLIESDGSPVQRQVEAYQSFKPVTARHVQNVLRHALTSLRQHVVAETEINVADLFPLDAGIEMVLRGCAIIRNLCAQARNTGFLRQNERIHLLYVFGHMGELGRQYLHQVMKWTYNYRYEITQRFINRILDKPIGCNSLRKANIDRPFVSGCNCDFPMVEGTYPSPVLHAMGREVDRRVTMPKRQHTGADDLTAAASAFQTHSRLLELAEQMLTLNKEKKRLEDEITECQQKLAVLFDRLKVDRYEIGIGTLARERQQSDAYMWRVDML